MIGSTLGHYRVLEKIGSGGMGDVYSAEDSRLERRVALKVLPEEMAANRERLRRFRREVKAVAALNHPNIVTLYSVEEADELRFFTMELVEGRSLDQMIPSEGLPLSQFFDIAIPIADALTAAHERKVVHRDLKPTNVMVSDTGRVKILDFGLAKVATEEAAEATGLPTQSLTQAGLIMGTVPYMSPEQVKGEPLDHRSDIFSLGVMLYEMCTGARPFTAKTSVELMSSIIRDNPSAVTEIKSELPRQLGRIVKRCLEKDSRRRYQTALDLSNELEELKSEVDSGASAVPVAALSRMVDASRRKSHRTPLIGRAGEMAQLERQIEQAEAGHGAVVMIGGELGVGKTRLVDELVTATRERGFLTLIGHCYEAEGTLPFMPWVEHQEYVARIAPRDTWRHLLGDSAPEVAKMVPELRRIFPDIPAPLAVPPEQERHHLFNSFREYTERSGQVQPLLMVLEDLQWADEPSLLLFQHLAQHADSIAMLMVGTYRDVELDRARPLAKTLRELVRERLVERVALKRLTQRDVRKMLAAMGGSEPPADLVAALFKVTEGNPFFVEEVFQHLEEIGEVKDARGAWRTDLRFEELEVPESIRLVLGRRLERLGEEASDVLTQAAVIGTRFSFELLKALGDFDTEVLLDGLEEAERLDLIVPVKTSKRRETRFRFAHELVRQTLASNLSLLRQQRLHLRIARAMEELYEGALDEHAASLAHHYFNAGAAADADKTLHYLTMAGRRALRSAAPRGRAALFRRCSVAGRQR